jgi:hypothetical protein
MNRKSFFKSLAAGIVALFSTPLLLKAENKVNKIPAKKNKKYLLVNRLKITVIDGKGREMGYKGRIPAWKRKNQTILDIVQEANEKSS